MPIICKTWKQFADAREDVINRAQDEWWEKDFNGDFHNARTVKTALFLAGNGLEHPEEVPLDEMTPDEYDNLIAIMKSLPQSEWGLYERDQPAVFSGLEKLREKAIQRARRAL